MTIAITELGPICVEMRARNAELFELLGSWVTSTSEPELQRLFATACHRHAWHAELWDRRTPRIGDADFGAASAVTDAIDIDGDQVRRDWYRQQLAEISEQLARLDAAGDAELDPSTARTVQLVATDIASLQARVA